MDVEAGEVDAGPEPMTLDRFQEGEQGSDDDDQEGDTWLNNLILQTQLDMWSGTPHCKAMMNPLFGTKRKNFL